MTSSNLHFEETDLTHKAPASQLLLTPSTTFSSSALMLGALKLSYETGRLVWLPVIYKRDGLLLTNLPPKNASRPQVKEWLIMWFIKPDYLMANLRLFDAVQKLHGMETIFMSFHVLALRKGREELVLVHTRKVWL